MNNINELASIVALEELKNHLVKLVSSSSEYDEWVIELYDAIKHDLETFKLLKEELDKKQEMQKLDQNIIDTLNSALQVEKNENQRLRKIIESNNEEIRELKFETLYLKDIRDFSRNKTKYDLYKTSEKVIDQLRIEIDRLNEEVEEEMHNYQDMGRLYHKTATRCDKLEKVITFLKDTFEITLDSKLRISDGIDCVQAFPLNLSTHEIVYDDVKEVLIDGK